MIPMLWDLLHQFTDDSYDNFLKEHGEAFTLNVISFLKQCKTPTAYQDIQLSSIRGFRENEINDFITALMVFYGLSPVQYGKDENLNIATALTVEVNGLESALKRKQESFKYLELLNDVFYYHGIPLEIKYPTYVYVILKEIYLHSDGVTSFISYKELCKKLKKFKEFRGKDTKKIEALIKQNITSKTEGLGIALQYNIDFKKTEPNGYRLMRTIRGKGICFNNGGENPCV